MKTAFIDLHLHLDGSLYLPWAYEVAKKEGVVAPTCTFLEYYNYFHSIDSAKTHDEAIKCFDFPIAVLQKREYIYQATYELIQRLHDQGLIYAEIRFASQQHLRGGLTQVEVLQAAFDAVEDAKKDFPDITIGLINCMMHKGENALFNEKENFETIEATKQFLGKGIVALDLAGFENNGDFMLYKPLFDKAREYGIPYTIHAGEMGEGKHVPEAISMGAHRIGHGINSVQNPAWVKEVVDKQIPLEVCVSSNCGKERNYAAHPIRQLFDAGAKVTVNCDNMSYSKTWLANEHEQLKSIGFTEEELLQCTYNAIDAAFCDEAIKEKLREQVKQATK